MKPLRDESIAQVQHALAEVLGEADGAFADRAELLVAIAETCRVSITEALIPWIHIRYHGKQWSAVEWRYWCERYAAALAEARQHVLRIMLADYVPTVQPTIAEMSGLLPDLYEGQTLREHMEDLRG